MLGIPSSLRPLSGQEPEEAGGAGHVPTKGIQRNTQDTVPLPRAGKAQPSLGRREGHWGGVWGAEQARLQKPG